MRTFDVVTCRLLFVVLIFSETLLGQAQKPTAPAAAAAKLQKLKVFCRKLGYRRTQKLFDVPSRTNPSYL